MMKLVLPIQRQYLKALEADNDSLTDLSFQFGHLATEQNLQIVSVFEGQKTKMPHFWRGSVLIVPKHSAQLGIGRNEQQFSISGGDHRNMCKFSTSDDPQYRQLSHAIKRISIDPLSSKPELDEVNAMQNLSLSPQVLCMKMLNTFDAISAKERVPVPVKNTLDWLLDGKKFKRWVRDEKAQLLWIQGPPGSGKTVISAHIASGYLQNLCPQSAICYFFCSRLSEDQNDGVGMLRGILYQLYAQRPYLVEHAIERQKTANDFAQNSRLLLDTFLQSVKDPRSGQVFLLVDALDECETVDAVVFLGRLITELKSTRLKVLITCRIDDRYDGLLETSEKRGKAEGTFSIHKLDLAAVKYRKNIEGALEVFIRAKVNDIAEIFGLDVDKANELRRKATQKADKTFLWVSLVLELLRDSASMSPTSIERILNSLPSTLQQTYHHILEQVRDEDRPMALKMLKVVAAARRPLSLPEIKVAFAVNPECRSEAELKNNYEPHIERTIRHLCKQIVTIADDKVHFVHSTVMDFLASLAVSDRPWYSFTMTDANLEMSTICNSYLTLSDFDNQPLVIEDFIHGQTQQSLVEKYTASFPFLNYAALYWAEHYECCEAQTTSRLVNQAMSISNVASGLFKTWFAVYCASQPRTFGYPKGLSTCHIAALNGHTTVIARLLNKAFDVRLNDDQGWAPLHWACYGGHASVVQQLIQAGSPIVFESTPKRPGMLDLAASRGHSDVMKTLLAPIKDANLSSVPPSPEAIVLALESAVRGGHTETMDLLLDLYLSDTDEKAPMQQKWERDHLKCKRAARRLARIDNTKSFLERLYFGLDITQDRSILTVAVETGNVSLVKTLVEAGAIINENPGSGPTHALTTLQSAAEQGNLEIVRYLIEVGANVRGPPAFHRGRTALQAAAGSGNLAVVNELLQHGASPREDPAPWMGVTAMQAAAAGGHLEIAQQLKEAGADINEPAPWRGCTALQWASSKGHLEFVKWLLQFEGLDLDATDQEPHYCQTAWQLAKEYPAIRELLEAAGATPEEKRPGFDYQYNEDGNLKPEFADKEPPLGTKGITVDG
ncbi:uncharacterized protein A1O9_11078 [Exophiala aquamarina CBS 119918]|uniref:NACHT domain-containing protein n=1 Tax=Exophiala aquamarina CBS 119918 TaxID=1182545 RepID=A0A072NYK5_9EURO|nr:uncharacterized protein A1O9_11078 [Exophiala aquamarina CBS 119918]KEF52661.1 hypothetical protein A1O9_11078 [Exophiala aquamarina CBS 119918]